MANAIAACVHFAALPLGAVRGDLPGPDVGQELGRRIAARGVSVNVRPMSIPA